MCKVNPPIHVSVAKTQTSQRPEPSSQDTPQSYHQYHHLPSTTGAQAHDSELYVREIIQNVGLCVWLFLTNRACLRPGASWGVLDPVV